MIGEEESCRPLSPPLDHKIQGCHNVYNLTPMLSLLKSTILNTPQTLKMSCCDPPKKECTYFTSFNILMVLFTKRKTIHRNTAEF